jgi:ankyrin repeat protein
LAIAKSDENLDCAKLLLKSGANMKVRDDFGNTLLHVAA